MNNEPKFQISESSYIYKNRRDVRALKARLLEKVDNPDYWPTLVSFLHKQISKDNFDIKMEEFLTTNEMKLLHNEMIRAIIYNAHFSMIPPPDVNVPRLNFPEPKPRKVPPAITKAKNSDFQTFSTADMMHLPTISQIFERIRFILFMKYKQLKVEPKVAKIMQKRLYMLITQLLRESLAYASPSNSFTGNSKISVHHLIHIYNSGSLLSHIVSPGIITKYTSQLTS